MLCSRRCPDTRARIPTKLLIPETESTVFSSVLTTTTLPAEAPASLFIYNMSTYISVVPQFTAPLIRESGGKKISSLKSREAVA